MSPSRDSDSTGPGSTTSEPDSTIQAPAASSRSTLLAHEAANPT